MAKKKLNTDKSWWAKIPSGIVEAIKIAVDDKTKYINALGFYTAVMIIFCNRKNDEGFIRLSMVKSFLGFGYRTKTKMLESVIFNKWLFYTKKIVIDKDILIQPVIDVNRMNETKVNSLLQAIRFNDYETLQRLSPNILDDKGNSKNLFEGENSSEENCSNGVPYGVSNGVSNGVPNGVPNEHQQRRARVNKRESKSESENRELNIEGKKDKGPLVREAESEPSLPQYQKTELDLITKQRLWKDYLENLKVDSKEMQALLNYAGEDRPMIENNFELFKFHLLNRTDFRRKDECPLTASDAGKNEYIYNLLKNSSERRNLVKHIQESIEAKRKRDFVQGKPGYPFDFYNKKGQRISGDRIVPDDAPPRPSDKHFWNGKFWNHR